MAALSSFIRIAVRFSLFPPADFFFSFFFFALDTGRWAGREIIPRNRLLEEQISRGKIAHIRDPAGFLQFLRMCLAWDPKRRAMASDLLNSSWLRSV